MKIPSTIVRTLTIALLILSPFQYSLAQTCTDVNFVDDIPDTDQFDYFEEENSGGGGGGGVIEVCDISMCEADQDYLSLLGGINIVETRITNRVCCDTTGCNCNKRNLQEELRVIDAKLVIKQELLSRLTAIKVQWEALLQETNDELAKFESEINPLRDSLVTATNLVANLFPVSKCAKALTISQRALRCLNGNRLKICAEVFKRQFRKDIWKNAGDYVEKNYKDIITKAGKKGTSSVCGEWAIEFVGGNGLVTCFTYQQTLDHFTSVIDQITERILKASTEIRKVKDRIRELTERKNQILIELTRDCCPDK